MGRSRHLLQQDRLCTAGSDLDGAVEAQHMDLGQVREWSSCSMGRVIVHRPSQCQTLTGLCC